tara:strand:- start:533 stop:922 length:390 start_codon:yes stop_codon:yes gene_type:complete
MKITPSFSDNRGEIFDIFVNSPKDHCAIITCNKGAVRGNHFHKQSTQFTFIVSGKFKLYRAKVDENGNLLEKVSVDVIEKNELIEHKPYEAHTFEAISDDALILAFACGERGGAYYENDTFRLKKGLNT